MTPNKSLHRTFDPLPIFAFAKTGIASNAGELRRWQANHAAPDKRRGIAQSVQCPWASRP
ncbi:MAG: hypothetical protein EVA65_04705 [Oceanococcus sp.]|nr:MAG: hypothetical protein EVA65_04705 [Oceanococcus sp.]